MSWGSAECSAGDAMGLDSQDMELLYLVVTCLVCCTRGGQKSVKTAVPDAGNPPGALVLTKLVEWYRFEVGHEKLFFVIFVTCRGGQRSNFGPKRSNFSPVPRHTKAKLEGPTPTKKARRAKRAAPYFLSM